MYFLFLVTALLTVASAAPSKDTTTVCMYLYKKYPQYLAFNPSGPNALLTANNAVTWIQVNTHYWNVEDSLQYQSACTFSPATAQQVSDAVVELNKFPSVSFALKV